jgi:hypothetical protein
MGLRTIFAAVLGCAALSLAAQQDASSQPPAQAPSTTQPQNESKPGQEQSPPPQNQPAPPTQAQPEQTPTPPQSQAPAEDKPAPPTTNPPSENVQPSTSKPASAPTKAKTVRKKRIPVAKSQSSTQSGKTVVRNGGASEGTAQISPGMSDDQARRQREATNQLLAATDANLKRVSGKQLTSSQQGTVDQISSYVRQSKAASASGDLSRARTLAFKAQLLSDELARK